MLTLSGKCGTFIHCFQICETKSPYEDTAVPTCAVIFTRSLICRTKFVQILFCIDKARKRSFTEVALNSVLEENAALAIDFEWEFLQIKTFTNSVFVVCPNYFVSFHTVTNLNFSGFYFFPYFESICPNLPTGEISSLNLD